MESRKIQPLICRHDLDGRGGVAGLRHSDVRDLGDIGRGQRRAVPGRDHHADALRSHEGHTVGVALGRHQVFDLGLRQGISGERLDALRGLSGGFLRRPLLIRRLLQQLDGTVPRLLPGEPGGGEVIRPGIDGVLPRRVSRRVPPPPRKGGLGPAGPSPPGSAELSPSPLTRVDCPRSFRPLSSPLTALLAVSAGGENFQLIKTAAPTNTRTVSTTAFFRKLSFLMLFLLQMTIDI